MNKSKEELSKWPGERNKCNMLAFQIPFSEEMYLMCRTGGHKVKEPRNFGRLIIWNVERNKRWYSGRIIGSWWHDGGGGYVVFCKDGKVRQCQVRCSLQWSVKEWEDYNKSVGLGLINCPS